MPFKNFDEWLAANRAEIARKVREVDVVDFLYAAWRAGADAGTELTKERIVKRLTQQIDEA